MNATVGCVGDLLVEIMRENIGDSLDRPGTFLGPYPSGASGIFIDAAARLGLGARFVGAVGKDDFGRLILNRFKADGVDTSHIKVLEKETTGVAFVTYFSDGSRKFIYHLAKAATGCIFPDDIDRAYFSDLRYLHIVGSTMFINTHSAEACVKAAHMVKNAGGKISFDPNFRPELLSKSEVKELFNPILALADIVFPTHEELAVLTGEKNIQKACDRLLDAGARMVAVKQGKRGSAVYTADEHVYVPAFRVDEIDPTGAGDCYCAGFLFGAVHEMGLEESARFANAVGALAVTRKGPMEGAPIMKEVRALLTRES